MSVCAYCGLPSDTKDHVIPQSEKAYNPYDKDHTVPCCRECNSTLGAKPFYSVAERASYLRRVYEKKYEKILKIPTWEPHEIEELSGRLQTNIMQSQWLKQEVRMRLEHLEYVVVIAPTIREANE